MAIDNRLTAGRTTPPGQPGWVPQLIAIDIDGTLVGHDDVVAPRVRDAIARAKDAGAHVVIATGRSMHGCIEVGRDAGLLHVAVCSNGAVTARLDTGHVIDAVTFDPRAVLTLVREHLPEALYAVEDLGRGFRVSAPFPEGELGGEVSVVSFDHLADMPATRVVVRSPDSTAEAFLSIVEVLGLHEVSYAVGWTAWLDLAPKGVSKASALERLRLELGVDPRATFAIGDGRNDVEMLQWAAYGVAVGSAPPEVRAIADEVTDPTPGVGVASILERLFPA